MSVYHRCWLLNRIKALKTKKNVLKALVSTTGWHGFVYFSVKGKEVTKILSHRIENHLIILTTSYLHTSSFSSEFLITVYIPRCPNLQIQSYLLCFSFNPAAGRKYCKIQVAINSSLTTVRASRNTCLPKTMIIYTLGFSLPKSQSYELRRMFIEIVIHEHIH